MRRAYTIMCYVAMCMFAVRALVRNFMGQGTLSYIMAAAVLEVEGGD